MCTLFLYEHFLLQKFEVLFEETTKPRRFDPTRRSIFVTHFQLNLDFYKIYWNTIQAHSNKMISFIRILQWKTKKTCITHKLNKWNKLFFSVYLDFQSPREYEKNEANCSHRTHILTLVLMHLLFVGSSFIICIMVSSIFYGSSVSFFSLISPWCTTTHLDNKNISIFLPLSITIIVMRWFSSINVSVIP